MELKSCPTSKYKDGYCWICPTVATHTRSVRADSILHRRKISFSTFLHLTWLYCDGIDVYNCARTLSLNHKTVQSLYTALQGSTSTSPGIPSLTCQDCRRTIRSGYADEPEGFDIVVRIAPCSKHSTRPATSRPISTAGAPPRQSIVQIVSSALTAAAQTPTSTPAPAAPAPSTPALAAPAPAAPAPAAPAPAAPAPAAPAPAAPAPAAPAPAAPAPAAPAPAAPAPAAPAPAAPAPSTPAPAAPAPAAPAPAAPAPAAPAPAAPAPSTPAPAAPAPSTPAPAAPAPAAPAPAAPAPSTPAPAAPAPAAPAPAAPAPAAPAPAAPAPAAPAPAAPAPAAPAPAAPAPSTPAPSTPAPAAPAPAAPAPAAESPRPLRRSRTFILPGVIAEYDRILARVKTGSNLTNAVKAEGLSLSFFSRKRCVAEAAKVDLPALQEGLLQQSTPTLKGTFPVAASICNQNLAVLRSMSLAGECILPKDRY